MAFLPALLILFVTLTAFVLGRQAALRFENSLLHSRPQYHGAYVAFCTLAAMCAVVVVWAFFERYFLGHALIAALPNSLKTLDDFQLQSVLQSVREGRVGSDADLQLLQGKWQSLVKFNLQMKLLALALAGGFSIFSGLRMVQPAFRARVYVENYIRWLLIACSVVAVLTTIGIVLSLAFETFRFFARYPVFDFLFGTQWSPQIALRADQGGASGAFGILPLLTGTLLITLIAMLVAAPVGLFSAIYLSEYASNRFRAWMKPALEVLAGVPTVVFGFFAALTVAPAIRGFGERLGLDVASESALAAGLVMGVMIIPFVSSLSDDVIRAVPQALRDGSYGIGATKSETIKRVVLPAALPGIVSALMLAISRAIGETMIVVMAAGLSARLTFNPFEAVTTFTVQIMTLLVGDQEFDSVKTLSAFALGFVLFFFTLSLNVYALYVVRKYREQYD